MTTDDISDFCDRTGHGPVVACALWIPEGRIYLCRRHWDDEMVWRIERNKELGDFADLDILPWPIWERNPAV